MAQNKSNLLARGVFNWLTQTRTHPSVGEKMPFPKRITGGKKRVLLKRNEVPPLLLGVGKKTENTVT